MNVLAESRFQLARLVARQALHLIAMGLLDLALLGLRKILRLVVVEPQRVLQPDHVRRARGLQQRLEVGNDPHGEVGTRRGDGLHPVRQRVSGEREKPRQRLGQVGPADGEWPEGVY